MASPNCGSPRTRCRGRRVSRASGHRWPAGRDDELAGAVVRKPAGTNARALPCRSPSAGTSVAVLYADDASRRRARVRRRRGRKACRYSLPMASACLAHITAARTAQAVQQMARADSATHVDAVAHAPSPKKTAARAATRACSSPKSSFTTKPPSAAGRREAGSAQSPGAGNRARAAALRRTRVAGDWRARRPTSSRNSCTRSLTAIRRCSGTP